MCYAICNLSVAIGTVKDAKLVPDIRLSSRVAKLLKVSCSVDTPWLFAEFPDRVFY